MNALRNLFSQNSLLSGCIALSLIFHGALFTLRFTAPDLFKRQKIPSGLEIILVNSKHDRKPLNPQAIAQANLDGGGRAEKGRAKSFLPDSGNSSDGTSLYLSQKRAEELEETQKKLLAQLKRTGLLNPNKKQSRANDAKGAASEENDSLLARQAAEIARKIEDQNKRPKKTFVAPSTLASEDALYYKKMQEKIEKMGTMRFPQKNGQKLYGKLMMSIPVFHDGTLYEKEGGPIIEASSGNKYLDDAAIKIVRNSAPFGNFPAKMRNKEGRDDVYVVITTFTFTRENGLETKFETGEEETAEEN